MSSPAAAEKALRLRAAGVEEAEPARDAGESEELLRSYVYDPTDQEGAQDQEPGSVVEQGSPASEHARLGRFAARAAELRGFERQVPLPVIYKGVRLDCGYRLDLLVEDLVIVELKAVDALMPIHEAQLLTYLRMRGRWLGLLINFNTPALKHGLKRLVNGM